MNIFSKLLSILLVLYISIAACNNDDEIVKATGMLEKQGITTYQYGTHVLKTNDRVYALQSSDITLDSFTNDIVTIWGEKIEGYPIEGGPVYLEVHTIKEE